MLAEGEKKRFKGEKKRKQINLPQLQCRASEKEGKKKKFPSCSYRWRFSLQKARERELIS